MGGGQNFYGASDSKNISPNKVRLIHILVTLREEIIRRREQ